MDTVDFHEGKCCKFALKTKDGCICPHITHCHWEFGSNRVGGVYGKVRLDADNYIDEDNLHYQQGVEEDACPCDYCVYRRNVRTDTHVLCFCCKVKLYVAEVDHCSDCNAALCHRCYVRGRYDDSETQVCYDCRSFGPHKNAGFYGNYSPYADADEQWKAGSWYY